MSAREKQSGRTPPAGGLSVRGAEGSVGDSQLCLKRG